MPFTIYDGENTTQTTEGIVGADRTSVDTVASGINIDNVLDDAIIRQVDEEVSVVRDQIISNEEELIGGRYFAENTDWEGVCDRYGNLKVIPLDVNHVSSEQLLLADQETLGNGITRLIITNPNHKLIRPRLIQDSPDTIDYQIYTATDNKINEKGLLIMIEIEESGMYCYTPFASGKKTYCLYRISQHGYRGSKMIYSVNTILTNEEIPTHMNIDNAISNSIISFRDPGEHLTEDDRVIISNTSSKFRKMVYEWHYLYDALDYFDYMIKNTIDHAYIRKLMQLSMDLSLTRPVPEEQPTPEET